MECPICFEDLHKAKILPCFHSFCEKCVKHLLKQSSIQCPLCRYEHKNIELKYLPTKLCKNLTNLKQISYKNEKFARFDAKNNFNRGLTGFRPSGGLDEAWGLIENVDENEGRTRFMKFLNVCLYVSVISLICFVFVRII